MRSFLLAAFSFFSAAVSAAAAQTASGPPQWFLDDIKMLTADGGRWIADNSAYKSDSEPYEAYGIEWVSGFDGATMTGRLFGLKDGKETANFWEFRQFWHPGDNQGVVAQFGWGGAVGIGVVVRDGAGTMSDQTFYNADKSVTRTGHKAFNPDPNTHVTDSFDIVGDEWKPRRKYVWKRADAN